MNQQRAIGRNGLQDAGNGCARDFAVECQDLPVDRRIDAAAEFDRQGSISRREDAGRGGHRWAGHLKMDRTFVRYSRSNGK